MKLSWDFGIFLLSASTPSCQGSSRFSPGPASSTACRDSSQSRPIFQQAHQFMHCSEQTGAFSRPQPLQKRCPLGILPVSVVSASDVKAIIDAPPGFAPHPRKCQSHWGIRGWGATKAPRFCTCRRCCTASVQVHKAGQPQGKMPALDVPNTPPENKSKEKPTSAPRHWTDPQGTCTCYLLYSNTQQNTEK